MHDHRVRILYVSHSAQLYGAEQSLLQLLKGLDRGRFYPVVVLPREGLLGEQLAADGVPVEIVASIKPWLTRRRGMLRLVNHVGLLPFLGRSVWVLRKLIHRYHIDVVHTNSLVIIDGGLAARLAGIPHVWHAREAFTEQSPYHFLFGPWGHKIALSLIGRMSDCIVAISSAVGHSLGRAGSASRLVVVHNAVDASAFVSRVSGAEIRQELGMPDEISLVGQVAKLTPVKGCDDFVMAAAQVHQAMPNTRFLAVGDALRDSYQRRISKLIEDLGMERNFRLLGFRRDVTHIMAALDLLVLPSHYEPFGRALIEAMAAGKPVIGTNVGGIPEIIEDGVTGLLVAPGAPHELAEAIIHILQNPELARRMGAAGRERARACFSSERYVAQIQQVYEELV